MSNICTNVSDDERHLDLTERCKDISRFATEIQPHSVTAKDLFPDGVKTIYLMRHKQYK